MEGNVATFWGKMGDLKEWKNHIDLLPQNSDSLTMIIPLFGALFLIPKRLPDLQHGHFRQNILPSLATSRCESLLDLSR